MLRMLNVCTRVLTTSRAGRTAGVAAIVAAAIVGAACSGSPAGPGVLSSERRVQDGGGGGTFCVTEPCTHFTGTVEVTAGGGTLVGASTGISESSPTTFSFTATLDKGTGRFETGFLDIRVTGDVATVNNLWFTNGNQTFKDAGKTVPATVVVGGKCLVNGRDPGTLVQTTIDATFENFGKTTIVEQHCLPL